MSTQDQTTPLPCPFCGHAENLRATGSPGVRFAVTCVACGAGTSLTETTPEAAIAKWNRRSVSPGEGTTDSLVAMVETERLAICPLVGGGWVIESADPTGCSDFQEREIVRTREPLCVALRLAQQSLRPKEATETTAARIRRRSSSESGHGPAETTEICGAVVCQRCDGSMTFDAGRWACPRCPDGRTHHAECWRTKGHHDCAIREIERWEQYRREVKALAERGRKSGNARVELRGSDLRERPAVPASVTSPVEVGASASAGVQAPAAGETTLAQKILTEIREVAPALALKGEAWTLIHRIRDWCEDASPRSEPSAPKQKTQRTKAAIHQDVIALRAVAAYLVYGNLKQLRDLGVVDLPDAGILVAAAAFTLDELSRASQGEPSEASGTRLLKAAQRFCAELQEDAEGVPQVELAELHAALDACESALPKEATSHEA